MTRGPQWLELVLGLLLGFSLGLAIAWGIAPNTRFSSSPATLRADYKDEYRLLIASAFTATGDVGRARSRLALLEEDDSVQALLEQALRIGSGQTQSIIFPLAPEPSVFALALLANAIQQTSYPPVLESTNTTAPIISLPTATFASFELVSQETSCDAAQSEGLTRIQVRDGVGQPLAGVQILVSSEDDQQRFFTGLKPELGTGYADFIMSPGILYNIQLVPSSTPVTGLGAPACSHEDGTSFLGGYLLVFKQP